MTLAKTQTYDAGWATITIIHEPDPDRVMEGLLLLLRWRIEDLRKAEGKLSLSDEFVEKLIGPGIKAGDTKK